MKMLLFLLLLLPECLYFIYNLSQNGLFVLINTPSILVSIWGKGDLVSILLLIIFTVGCIVAAIWSARHVGLIPQATISLVYATVLVVASLFGTTVAIPQILFNLITQPIALMTVIFPPVCLGTTICMLLMQPIARMTRQNAKIRIVLHKQASVILTLLTCLFMSAALYTVSEAFKLNGTTSLPTAVNRYISTLSLFPGNIAIKRFLNRIPLLIRLIVLIPSAITTCLWQISSVRAGLRRTQTSLQAQPIRTLQHPSSTPATVRPISTSHPAMSIQTRTNTTTRQSALRTQPRVSTANRERAMLDAMERTVRSGGVAGLNTRTGSAAV